MRKRSQSSQHRHYTLQRCAPCWRDWKCPTAARVSLPLPGMPVSCRPVADLMPEITLPISVIDLVKIVSNLAIKSADCRQMNNEIGRVVQLPGALQTCCAPDYHYVWPFRSVAFAALQKYRSCFFQCIVQEALLDTVQFRGCRKKRMTSSVLQKAISSNVLKISIILRHWRLNSVIIGKKSLTMYTSKGSTISPLKVIKESLWKGNFIY